MSGPQPSERQLEPGQGLSALVDLRDVMDRGQVLIVNLSKGRLGEDNSTLLGALLVTSIQQAAMTRAEVPEIERRDFSLYIDEFQNFTTGSFASVLSEARKYRLSLIVAHQYLTQLDEPTANAVFGNVGSIVTFQVGSDDAERLAEQLGKKIIRPNHPRNPHRPPQIHRLRPPPPQRHAEQTVLDADTAATHECN